MKIGIHRLTSVLTEQTLGAMELGDEFVIWLIHRMDDSMRHKLKDCLETHEYNGRYTTRINYYNFARAMNGDRWTLLKLNDEELERFAEMITLETKERILSHLGAHSFSSMGRSRFYSM